MASSFVITRRFFSAFTPLYNVFNHVTVVGGGLMGSGIAQVTAQSGMDVTVVEIDEEAVKKSEANIKSSMQRVAKKLFQTSTLEANKYIAETMGRLTISMDLEETVSKTDLVVEAIVEDLDVKHRLFSRIDAAAPEHTIFTSNTSSLAISEIAAVTTRKDRFGGLHFFNPVPVMKLLEIIRTEETSEATFQKMMSWGKAIGKTCITCKDTPGFVVNRLLVPYLAEAVRMLDRGDASAKDIDLAMKLGAGYPMGPLELLDYVGLDTTKFIIDGWHKKYPGNPLFAPIALLDKLVAEGKLGKKSGEGFYSYKKSPGHHLLPRYSPYFEPLPSSSVELSPPEPPDEIPKSGNVKKLKFEKMESEPYPTHPREMAKMERQEKMKKLEKLKSLDRWKNSDEYIRYSESDGKYWNLNKGPAVRLQAVESYVSGDVFRVEEKLKNFQDFIRYERERERENFRPEGQRCSEPEKKEQIPKEPF